MDICDPNALSDYLPISRINQYLYCPRRFWLVYYENAMVVDSQMLEGILHHVHVHDEGNSKKRSTAVPVCSERLGLVGTLDALERSVDGLTVIEHKRGSTRQWANDKLQVTAQAIAYEEMTGQAVVWGSVFSWQSRRRYRFALTAELRAQVETTVTAMRQIIANGKRPAPTAELQKCKGCSMHDVCQPALIRKLQKQKTGKKTTNEKGQRDQL